MRRGALGLLALALCLGPGCSGSDELLGRGPALYSQFDEELIIRDFFDDRREGFFVDVGAYHWRRASTTYYLEERLGWTGIAIDAQAGFAPGYEEHRPNTRFFAYIVTDHSGTEETLYLAGPVSSTVEHHVDDLAGHLEDEEKAEQVREAELREVRVPTITLNELLDREGVGEVDFLSMDIEQGEPAALAGFDIERFRPELVCIEAVPSVREAISDYFERHGYARLDRYLAYDEHNWYYAPRAGP